MTTGGDTMTGADLQAMRARQIATGREIAAMFGVPDHLVGLPTGPVRRWWQRHVTRRPAYDNADVIYRVRRYVGRKARNARRHALDMRAATIAGTLGAGMLGTAVALTFCLAVKGWL